MKIKLFILTTIFVAIVGLISPSNALALSTNEIGKYPNEKLSVNQANNSRVTYLKTRLEDEVNRIIDKGHLEPAYVEVGIMESYILWGNPGEQIYILSLTLPYLTSQTQTKLKTFLNQEIRTYDPLSLGFEHCQNGWGSCEMTGNRREFYSIPAAPNPDPIKPNLWPQPNVPVEAIYMVWSYADKTGDWSYISTNTTTPSGTRWEKIKSLFNSIPASPTTYGQIAGAIGYVRLLQKYNMTNDATYSQALSKIAAGMTSGIDFKAFLNDSYSKYVNFNYNHDWAFTPFHYLRTPNATGAMFAPEVGRYLKDHALNNVKKAVVFNPDDGQTGEVAAIESNWPTWYMNRGPYAEITEWVGHYGENHMLAPDTPWGVFMLEAYTLSASGEQLFNYLSSPFSIGDLYYIQKVVATIEGYSQKCWENIQSGAKNCENGSTPTPTATPVSCKEDLTNDGFVDLSDYNVIATNLLSTSPSNPKADIDKNGIVDLTDYSILAMKFLQQCN